MALCTSHHNCTVDDRFGSSTTDTVKAASHPCLLCPRKRKNSGEPRYVRFVPEPDSCTVVKELVRVPQLIVFARLFPMSHLTAQSSWVLSWEFLFAFRAS